MTIGTLSSTVSQMRADSSLDCEAVTKRNPSRLNAHPVSGFPPPRETNIFPVDPSHIRANPSKEDVRICDPSLLNAALEIEPTLVLRITGPLSAAKIGITQRSSPKKAMMCKQSGLKDANCSVREFRLGRLGNN